MISDFSHMSSNTENKSSMPATVRTYRGQIIQDIMDGLSPEEAFARVIGR